ncbi:MAG: TPM domain-containing protein [Candidatus Tantalella remota]|nr:TPM domain-containing protein [Candidatus Tantalella remota]
MHLKRNTLVIAALLVCVLVAGVSVAEDMRTLRPVGFVNDFANIISANTRAQLNGLLSMVERQTTVEMTVVTVKTTAPLNIEQYAVGLFQKWGIGKKGKDNGVLILVASGDRKVRIEVGYGLEGAVTDLKSKMIINELMVPAFKQGDYGAGIASAVAALTGIIGREYGVEFDLKSKAYTSQRHPKKRSPLSSLITLLFFMLIFGVRFGSVFFLMSGGGGYWSSGSRGSFGGGFGGFGGGMSGGGGASGGW